MAKYSIHELDGFVNYKHLYLTKLFHILRMHMCMN